MAVKDYIKYKYGDNFDEKIGDGNGLVKAKIDPRDENKIILFSDYSEGKIILDIENDKVEIKQDIIIPWKLEDENIAPEKTLGSQFSNNIISDLFSCFEQITAQCDIVKPMNYELKIGEGYKYKYPEIYEVSELFVDLEIFCTDVNLKKNNNITNMKKFLWALNALSILQKSTNIKYNLFVNGLNIKDSNLSEVTNNPMWNGSISNIESIMFEDCTIDITSSESINIFERGTKIIYKMSNCLNKEFYV